MSNNENLIFLVYFSIRNTDIYHTLQQSVDN